MYFKKKKKKKKGKRKKVKTSYLHQVHLVLEAAPQTIQAPRPLCVCLRLFPFADVQHHFATKQVQETRWFFAFNDSNLETDGVSGWVNEFTS